MRWRVQRGRNIRRFLELTEKDKRFGPVSRSFGEDVCPFNAILLFISSGERDAARRLLASHGVYAAVHWAQPESAGERIRDLGERILTIPLDQRYGESDAARIARILVPSDKDEQEPSDA